MPNKTLERIETLIKESYCISLENAKKTLQTMLAKQTDQGKIATIKSAIASIEAVLANL